MFVPEQATSQKYSFAYSIRMSLLPEGCIINGMTFSSCQLHWRHWIIRAKDVVIADVNGEAVVGQVQFQLVNYFHCPMFLIFFFFFLQNLN